jgi:hypothetical protein
VAANDIACVLLVRSVTGAVGLGDLALRLEVVDNLLCVLLGLLGGVRVGCEENKTRLGGLSGELKTYKEWPCSRQ